jgi:hypothetical protein
MRARRTCRCSEVLLSLSRVAVIWNAETADEIRVCDQPEDGKGSGPDDSAVERIRRRLAGADGLPAVVAA